MQTYDENMGVFVAGSHTFKYGMSATVYYAQMACEFITWPELQ